MLSIRVNPLGDLSSSAARVFVLDLVNFFQKPVPAEGREEGEVEIADAKEGLRRQENDPLRIGIVAGCVSGWSGRGEGKPASMAESEELDEWNTADAALDSEESVGEEERGGRVGKWLPINSSLLTTSSTFLATVVDGLRPGTARGLEREGKPALIPSS